MCWLGCDECSRTTRTCADHVVGGVRQVDVTTLEHADGVVMPLVLDVDGTPVRMFTTIATFGSPREVTLSELAIETFYPADPPSAAVLARVAP